MPRKPTMRRTDSTTSCEVFPEGLLTTMSPSKGGNLGGRGINDQDFSGGKLAAWQVGGIARKPARTLQSLRGFCLAQEALDAVSDFLGLVQHKNDFGSTAQMQAIDQFMAHETRRGLQPGESGSAFGFIPKKAHEHADGAHARAQTNFGDQHRSGETWILQFSGEHQAHFVAHFFGNSFTAMPGVVPLRLHDSSPSS